MALKNCVITTIISIFILTTIISAEGAQKGGRGGAADPKGSSPALPHKCAKKYISVHLNDTTTRTKEFLKNNIMKRLHHPTTLKSDKPCLIRFFQAYHAAIVSIEKAAVDFSKHEFSSSVVDVVAYGSFVGSTMKLNCSKNMLSPNSEFAGMQKWVENRVSNLLNRLIICTNISRGDAFAEPK